MILFLGTRPGKPKTVELSGARCSYCGLKGTLQATSIPNYFHFFWIPVFTISISHYAECGHCRRYYSKAEFTEEMKEAMR